MANEDLLRKPMVVYIAGPYTATKGDMHDAPRVAHHNTENAIRAGIEVMKKGHFAYIPHLTHFIHLQMRDDEAMTNGFWYQYDINWLEKCEALLYLGSSRGADAELKWAQEHNLKIFYSLDEIPNVSNSVDVEKHKVKM